MKYLVVLALAACSHTHELRGDWCGYDREQLRWAGELAEKCDGGDFLACERAEAECKRGSAFFCRSRAADMLPASSQGPADDTRADALQRRISH